MYIYTYAGGGRLGGREGGGGRGRGRGGGGGMSDVGSYHQDHHVGYGESR